MKFWINTNKSVQKLDMKKILLSWMAYSHDFEKNTDKVLENSPTISAHKFFYAQEKHDKHLMLIYQSKDEMQNKITESRQIALCSEIKKQFKKHIVEVKKVPLDTYYDYKQIHDYCYDLLPKLSQEPDCQIDILFSTGVTIARAVWVELHLAGIANTRLIQGIDKENKFIEVQIQKNKSLGLTTITSEEKIPEYPLGSLVKKVYAQAKEIASFPANFNVLIRGENGTGKERLAKYLHDNSSRKSQPFETVNCAAFSDELLRSELFGHEKGSFTGANKDKKGLIEQVENGTLFLDEIGDISLANQAALLRFIQFKEYRKVGSNEVKKANVWLISATNQALENLIKENSFRTDFFHRISELQLDLPTFREYSNKDKKQAIEYYLKETYDQFNEKFENYEDRISFSESAWKRIYAHPFYGNFRELHNFLNKCIIFPKKIILEAQDLPLPQQNTFSEKMTLAEVESLHIQRVLEHNKGNKEKTCQILGLK